MNEKRSSFFGKYKDALKDALGRKKPAEEKRDPLGMPLVSYEREAIGSVDRFDYTAGRLTFRGWVWDTKETVKASYIAYYCDGKCVAFHRLEPVLREDVAAAIGRSEAIRSGFCGEADVRSNTGLQVYAEYLTPSGRGVLFLGNIPPEEGAETVSVTFCETEDLIRGLSAFLQNREAEPEADLRAAQELSGVAIPQKTARADREALHGFILQELEKKKDAFPGANEKKARDYRALDPLREEAVYARICRLLQDEASPVTVAFDHLLGGGATIYLEEQCTEALDQGSIVAVMRYDRHREIYRLLFRWKEEQIEVWDRSPSILLKLLRRVDQIWVNELYSYPALQEMFEEILALKDRTGARLCCRINDYFCICPAVHFVDSDFRYCGIAASEVCDTCVQTNTTVIPTGYSDTAGYRSAWERFLLACDEVTVFSESSRTILKRAYPSLSQICLEPHRTEEHTVPARREHEDGILRIGILGTITEIKGRLILEECAKEIEEAGRKDHLVIIGTTNRPLISEAVTVHGIYQTKEITRLTERYGIDLFLIPSICPETFSYTTSEIISMKMPLAVFDIGAPPERVRDYEKGLVIPVYRGAAELLDQLERFGEQMKWQQ